MMRHLPARESAILAALILLIGIGAGLARSAGFPPLSILVVALGLSAALWLGSGSLSVGGIVLGGSPAITVLGAGGVLAALDGGERLGVEGLALIAGMCAAAVLRFLLPDIWRQAEDLGDEPAYARAIDALLCVALGFIQLMAMGWMFEMLVGSRLIGCLVGGGAIAVCLITRGGISRARRSALVALAGLVALATLSGIYATGVPLPHLSWGVLVHEMRAIAAANAAPVPFGLEGASGLGLLGAVTAIGGFGLIAAASPPEADSRRNALWALFALTALPAMIVPVAHAGNALAEIALDPVWIGAIGVLCVSWLGFLAGSVALARAGQIASPGAPMVVAIAALVLAAAAAAVIAVPPYETLVWTTRAAALLTVIKLLAARA